MCKQNMDEMDDKKERVSSSNRRTNKPLMEKRRRQRINECLGQLKSLVLQAMKKDTTQYSKLEKADILEMTVKHLKMVQRQQMTAAMTVDPNVISKYRAGFNECSGEISRYLDTVHGGSPDLKMRVMSYLSNCVSQFPVVPVYQGHQNANHQAYQFPASTQAQTNFLQQFQHGGLPMMPGGAFLAQHELSQQTQSALDNISRQGAYPTCSSNASFGSISPNRRVPSPCDSDSGLSDSSTSISQDENGNYHQFNIRDPDQLLSIKTEPDVVFAVPKDLRKGTLYSQRDQKISPKRSHEYSDEISPPKRQRTRDNIDQSDCQPLNMVMHHVPESESMWRPW